MVTKIGMAEMKHSIRIAIFGALLVGEVACLYFIWTLVSDWEFSASHKMRLSIRAKQPGIRPHEEEVIMNGAYSTYMASLGVLAIYSLLFTGAYGVTIARGIPKVGPALEEYLLKDKSCRPSC